MFGREIEKVNDKFGSAYGPPSAATAEDEEKEEEK